MDTGPSGASTQYFAKSKRWKEPGVCSQQPLGRAPVQEQRRAFSPLTEHARSGCFPTESHCVFTNGGKGQSKGPRSFHTGVLGLPSGTGWRTEGRPSEDGG